MKHFTKKLMSLVAVIAMVLTAVPAQAVFQAYNWKLWDGSRYQFGQYIPAGYGQDPITISYYPNTLKAVSTKYATVVLQADGGLRSWFDHENNYGIAPFAFAWTTTPTPPTFGTTTYKGETFDSIDWFLAGEVYNGEVYASNVLDVNDAINKIVGSVDLNEDGAVDTAHEKAAKEYVESKRLVLGQTYYFHAIRYGGSDLFETSGYHSSTDFVNSAVVTSTAITMPATATMHTVTFNTNGGSAITAQLIANGETAVRPTDPTRNGYSFAGWYATADFSTVYNFNNPITANTTIYAKWDASTVPTFTVTFNSLNGSYVAPQQVAKGQYAVRPVDPTKSGYTFDNWYTGEDYTTPFNFNNPITAPVTAVARWTAVKVEQYTVTFNTNEGTFIPSQTVGQGQTIVRPTNPTRSGYVFVDWYTDAALTNAYNFSSPVNSSFTLYAKWIQETVDQFVVSFNSNGGTSIASQVVAKNGYVTKPTDPIRESFTFAGWYVDAALANAYNFSSPVTSSFTLYAKWTSKETTYTVTFNSNGGTAVPTQTVIAGQMATRPAAPTKSGYGFMGWFSDANLTTAYEFNVPVNANITVYAKWMETPTLDKLNHYAYIFGYEDGEFRPDRPISRAEAAQIFFRLLTNTDKNEPVYNRFVDVPNDAWYKQAVTYLSTKNIITGYESNDFRPNAYITRAEFATIAARFDNLESAANTFVDVPSTHWAAPYIASAAKKGWVAGYSGGYFLPDNQITRAEVVTLVNRILERGISKEKIPAGTNKFIDLSSGHWAYEAIIEAATSHSYEKDSSGLETWL